MSSKTTATATLLSLLALQANGFHLPQSHNVGVTTRPNHRAISTSQLSMATEELTEVEKLRAAAAKAREEYERLSKEMGKEVDAKGDLAAAGTVVEAKNLSVTEVQDIATSLNFGTGDAASQITKLDDLVESGDFSLWNSAVRRAGSSMSKLVPFPVTLQTLESRTGGKVTGPSLGIDGDKDVSLDDFKDLTVQVVLGSTLLGILSLAVLPENVGATFTYLFALIPIAFIGIGSLAPGVIASGIVFSRGDSEDAERQRERICRHEAGHFLCGYLCGLPVKNYEISSDTGVACVEFHQADSMNAKGELSDEDIAALSVVAMSGSVAEIIAYEKATGGENDLLELQNCFRRSKEFIGAASQQDLTRWGALTSYGLINANKVKYDKLVDAFKSKKGISECVAIIEGSA